MSGTVQFMTPQETIGFALILFCIYLEAYDGTHGPVRKKTNAKHQCLPKAATPRRQLGNATELDTTRAAPAPSTIIMRTRSSSGKGEFRVGALF